MDSKIMRTLDELKGLIFSGMIILIVQKSVMRSEMNNTGAIIGMAMIILISVISLRIKDLIPLNIPAFAWASLLALLMSAPFFPLQEQFLGYVNNVGFSMVSTIILAVAGISIGTRLNEIKKLSWKIFVVSIAVFIGTFFGSAIIAHIVLKAQGII